MVKCFLCENSDVIPILNLGDSPIANNLERDKNESIVAEKILLILGKCNSDCNHVQIVDRVDQNKIFDEYFYVSSVSTTLSDHLSNIALELHEKFSLDENSFVVDIGSNDGTFLNAVKSYTTKFLGIDPAKNLSDFANKNGLTTLNAFFGSDVAQDVVNTRGKSDYIVSTNTFAHTPKIRDFIKGLKVMLSSDGVGLIEVHYLGSMLESNAFDTIYHEHFSYWSLTNLRKALLDFNLEIFDVQILPVHHGQIRIFISHPGVFEIKQSVNALLSKELVEDIHGSLLQLFSDRVNVIKKDLAKLFAEIKSRNEIISGYGAPAKACTMLSFLNFNDLKTIYDKSSLKQGKYLPGTPIKISSPANISVDNPDYIFLFARNFVDEIISELKEEYKFTGKVIVPIPKLAVSVIDAL